MVLTPAQNQLQKSTSSKNFYFSEILRILGDNPCSLSKIVSDLNISKQKLNYYIKPLKVEGIIKKIGYGVWEVNPQKHQELIGKDIAKQVKKSTLVANDNIGKIFTSQGKVRGHGFQITLRIPQLKNWNKRREYLEKKKIEYTPVGNALWDGERIEINGAKVHLTPSSIIFYAPKWLSWFADTSKESKSHVIYDFIQVIKKLETMLNIQSFTINQEYRFKVTKQHYALVKNTLAEQYDHEGKKLYCYADKGLWLIIDNSYNLHELEGTHPRDADIDIDNKVAPFFNSLERNPITVDQILGIMKAQLDMIGNVTANQVTFDKNHQKHQEILDEIGKGVRELTKAVQGINNIPPKTENIYSKTAYKRHFPRG